MRNPLRSISERRGFNRLFMNFGFLPTIAQPDDGGYQQHPHGDQTGDGSGVGALGGEGFHIAVDGVIHGVVDARPGDQGEEGDHQIGNGGVFAHPCHNLGISGGEESPGKVGEGFAAGELLDQHKSHPGQHAPQGAQQPAGTMDIE